MSILSLNPERFGWPIRVRLALVYALFLVGTIAVVGAFVLATLQADMIRQVDSDLALRVGREQKAIDLGPNGRLDAAEAKTALADLAPEEEFAAPGIYVQLLDGSGVALASSPNLPAGQFPPTRDLVETALAGHPGYATVPVGTDRVRVLASPMVASGQVVGVMLVGQSLHFLDVTVRQIERLLAIAALVAALVSLAGGWFLTGRALGPVATVIRVARKIAATGQFEQRIPTPRARDELHDLVATLNDMLAGLARTFHRQREFLADASHQLRGPLTVIRGNLDLLALDLPDAERRVCIKAATDEVERMSHLVDDLLFLAEVDAQETVLRQPVALDEIMISVFQRACHADVGCHAVSLGRNDSVRIVGDPERLEQLAWNLVENALRYTGPGGKVALSLENLGETAEIVVADSGVGIPAEHLPRIFERFYRVDRARSRPKGSSGLGLAIVQQIAVAHGGEVRVESEPGRGSTFTVVLPTNGSAGLPS